MAHHYSLSTKLNALALYRQGYGSTTIARQLKIDPTTIRQWVNKHIKNKQPVNREPSAKFTPEFKIQLVREVLKNSLLCSQVALKYSVNLSTVKSWVGKVKTKGYSELYPINQKGRPRQPMPRGRPKKQEPQTELELLKVELERARTENALLKKVIALVKQREARMQKIAKSGLKPSKN